MSSNTHFVIVRLSAIGDVVLITGVLEYLHKHYGYTFTVITKESQTTLLENHPAITEIISLTKENTSPFRMLSFIFSQYKNLLSFPLIDLHCTLRTRVFSFFWKSTVYRYAKKTLLRRIYLYTRNKKIRTNLLSDSVTQRYYKAFLPILPNKKIPTEKELQPKAYITTEEQEVVRKKFLPPSKYVILHPYTSYTTKMWDVPHWEKLCSLLHSLHYPYIIVGQDKNPILQNVSHNYTNKTNLREIYALLSDALVLVTADSSLLHMALAVNTSTISLFGPTTKEWGFYPPSPEIIKEHPSLPCRPCSLHGNKECKNTQYKECLNSIKPEYVIEDIQTFYNNL